MTAIREATPPLITTKQQLVYYLGEAAVLEQQFMCQYLYAAFSLKKSPDATCTAAQFEHVRRWASTIYMIARQEMEHLSVVNSILTAVGGEPVLYHLELPTQSAWYQGEARAALRGAGEPLPCDLPFLLTPFDLAAARRFACMESPHLDDVPPADRARVLAWCFQDAGGHCPMVGASADALGAAAPWPVTPKFAHAKARAAARAAAGAAATGAAVDGAAAPPATVEPGTIQELYTALEAGLLYLDAELGSAALFDGHASGQAEIPSEYQIYLYPICDLASALAGIRMVMKQGEGLDAPPGYDSHFQHYYDIAVDYEALLADDPRFEAAVPVAWNPPVAGYADPATRLAVETWREGYVTLLYMLTGYFAYYSKQGFAKYPYLSAALSQTTFAPLMTMLVRSLAEVVVQLDGAPYAARAGVDFNITAEELHLLDDPTQPPFQDVAFYRDRLGALVEALGALEAMLPPEPAGRVRYIRENLYRVWGNLSEIYQQGVFPLFDPNTPYPSCPPGDCCD